MFNRNLFRAKVIERGLTLQKMAVILGCDQATLYRKLKGDSDFSRNEIQLSKVALALSALEVDDIFFAEQLT